MRLGQPHRPPSRQRISVVCDNRSHRWGMVLRHLEIPDRLIAEFCQRWKVRELSVFGSVLREDFGPASDVDVLVCFDADAERSLLDLVIMQQELSRLLGRVVDLVEQKALRNPYRRSAILNSKHVVYAA